MAGISSKAAGSLENKKNKFQNQEYNDDLGVDMYEFKYRMDDPQTGRFWQIDPLADKYVYNSTYAFSENKVTSHVELEGLEVIPLFETTLPVEEVITSASTETQSSGLSTGTLSNMSRGNQTEAEQLLNNGLEKNTKPIEVIDPKTGNSGKTVPDAMKNEGKSTVEIKDVKNQSLTRQLRLQEKFSKDNGFKPELIINNGAKLSKPLKNSTFDIKPYIAPPAIDNTYVKPPVDPTKIKPKPKRAKTRTYTNDDLI